MDGRVHKVVGGHIGQEEGKEEVVVEHTGMGKCEAEERNCCSAAGVW